MGDLREEFESGWTGGLPETMCGHGSTLWATKAQRNWIPDLIEDYDILSIVDIGAGDLNWIKQTDIPHHVDYSAYDLVPRHPEVLTFDLLKEVPPQADMIMCLWVLNHLSYDDCRLAITNIRKSGSRFLLMTDRPSCREYQPPEIVMPYVASIRLNEKGDSMKLIDLYP